MRGNINLGDVMANGGHGFSAQVETTVVLGAFEMELDALLDELDHAGGEVSESVLRRYISIQELVTSLLEGVRRIELKMVLVGEAVTGASDDD